MRQDTFKIDRLFARRAVALVTLAALLLLGGCFHSRDPHAGMAQVFDGENLSWIRPWKDAPLNDRTAADFYTPDAGLLVSYTGEDYIARQGIDVSYFQGEIDWQAVADDGIEFAIIRAGYRGYTDGNLNMDESFPANAQGALDAGLDIGLYIFSQATTEAEAEAEARWLLEAAARYDVTLPLVYDWETIGESAARTDGMPGSQMTQCALAFCRVIREAGYTPAVYCSRWQACYDYDLGALADAELWLTADDVAGDFYYAHSLWQYTYEGSVNGIEGAVDRDLQFIPVRND